MQAAWQLCHVGWYPMAKILYTVVDARPVFKQQPAVSQFLQDRDLEIPHSKSQGYIRCKFLW